VEAEWSNETNYGSGTKLAKMVKQLKIGIMSKEKVL